MTAVITALIPAQAQAEALGIDVSRWQGVIDWNATSTATGFAIIKAGGSDGELYADSQFVRNRDEARRLGMARGYYYFAGGGNPIAEAEHFASIVGPLQPGEIVALDYEIDHPNPVGYSLQFMIRTEELMGVKPFFYTNMNRVWGIDWTPVAERGYPLWGAIYDQDPINMPGSGAWPEVTIKQYSSSGQVAGITANSVDMNRYTSPVPITDRGYQPPLPPAVVEPPQSVDVALPAEQAPAAPETELLPGLPTESPAAEVVIIDNGEGISATGYAGDGGKFDWKQKLIDADAGLEEMIVGEASEATARCVLGISCSEMLSPQAALELTVGVLTR